MKIDIVFIRKRDLFSKLVCFLTWSPFSHVEILINENECIGAVFDKGVRKYRLERVLRKAEYWEIHKVEASEKVIECAKAQLGKKYDVLGLFGFIFRNRRWQRDDKWFCSEFVAFCFEKAGYSLFKARPYKVSPRDLLYSPLLKKKSSSKQNHSNNLSH